MAYRKPSWPVTLQRTMAEAVESGAGLDDIMRNVAVAMLQVSAMASPVAAPARPAHASNGNGAAPHPVAHRKPGRPRKAASA